MAYRMKVNSIPIADDDLFGNHPNNYKNLDDLRVFNQDQLYHLLTPRFMRQILGMHPLSVFISHQKYMSKMMELNSNMVCVATSCKNRLSVRQVEEFARTLAQRCPTDTNGDFQVYYSITILRNGDEPDSEIVMSVNYFDKITRLYLKGAHDVWPAEITWK